MTAMLYVFVGADTIVACKLAAQVAVLSQAWSNRFAQDVASWPCWNLLLLLPGWQSSAFCIGSRTAGSCLSGCSGAPSHYIPRRGGTVFLLKLKSHSETMEASQIPYRGNPAVKVREFLIERGYAARGHPASRSSRHFHRYLWQTCSLQPCMADAVGSLCCNLSSERQTAGLAINSERPISADVKKSTPQNASTAASADKV